MPYTGREEELGRVGWIGRFGQRGPYGGGTAGAGHGNRASYWRQRENTVWNSV